jgi:hypothetical protein
MALIIDNSIEGIIKLLFHENEVIKKSMSWFILQVTDNFTKNFDREILNWMIPTLINSLNANAYIAVNICYSLINLIKGLGDPNTVKNSSKIVF